MNGTYNTTLGDTMNPNDLAKIKASVTTTDKPGTPEIPSHQPIPVAASNIFAATANKNFNPVEVSGKAEVEQSTQVIPTRDNNNEVTLVSLSSNDGHSVEPVGNPPESSVTVTPLVKNLEEQCPTKEKSVSELAEVTTPQTPMPSVVPVVEPPLVESRTPSSGESSLDSEVMPPLPLSCIEDEPPSLITNKEPVIMTAQPNNPQQQVFSIELVAPPPIPIELVAPPPIPIELVVQTPKPPPVNNGKPFYVSTLPVNLRHTVGEGSLDTEESQISVVGNGSCTLTINEPQLLAKVLVGDEPLSTLNDGALTLTVTQGNLHTEAAKLAEQWTRGHINKFRSTLSRSSSALRKEQKKDLLRITFLRIKELYEAEAYDDPDPEPESLVKSLALVTTEPKFQESGDYSEGFEELIPEEDEFEQPQIQAKRKLEPERDEECSEELVPEEEFELEFEEEEPEPKPEKKKRKIKKRVRKL